MNKLKILEKLAVFLLHLIAIALIILSFADLANWYFTSKPLWGVDFYYTTSLVTLLKDNLTHPATGWGYAWFSGWPLLSNYPVLHYYLILPLTSFFFIISAVKIWMLVSLILFFFGCYACFYVLSRNLALSLTLAFAGIYSVGVYGTLMWGGSLPSHATQAFLPWVAYFIIRYLRKNNIRHLLIAGLLAGAAIWGHPQVVIAYIYPTVGILLLLSFGKLTLFKRIKAGLLFLLISFFIGLPLFYSSLGTTLKVFFITDIHHTIASSTARTPSDIADAIAAFHRAQPYRIYFDTNTTIFILLGAAFLLYLLGFVIARKKDHLLEILPFIFLTVFSALYVWIFAYGISIYHGGWYRLFWATPFWLGLLGASLWGAGQLAFKNKLAHHVVFHLVLVTVSIGLLVGGYVLVTNFSEGIKDKIAIRSNTSSAFPDVLNLRSDKEGFERLKGEMVPSWFDPNQTNYRLYSGDQTVSIWWNTLYKMPLARGYFDPPLSVQNRGYFFWVDAALSQDTKTGEDQLAGSFKYPVELSLNNTQFLIDWYGIKYFEAGHAGPTVYAPLPKRLTTPDFIANQEEMDFNKERYNKGKQTLNYYELKDEFVSPIMSATNAPTLGIISSDEGYETVVRDIADLNISSRQLIPLKLGKNIDNLNSSDFNSLDALILYDYDYSNQEKAFKLVNDFVKKGKKVFIDSGVEVKEAASSNLPNVFPHTKSYREQLGTSWQFELLDQEFGKDIDFSKFDPPLFDKAPWNLSFPQQDSDIRANSKIILKNQGKAIMMSRQVESGEVIWSGMNLPYHVARYHNIQESALFKRILDRILSRNPNLATPNYQVKFNSATNRKIETENSKGVLFKEQAYDGWSAKLSLDGGSKNLKIYRAGPAYPGFIYVRFPEQFQNQKVSVEFKYLGGKVTWMLSLISLIITIFIIDEIILRGKTLGKVTRIIRSKASSHIKKWWAKEDET